MYSQARKSPAAIVFIDEIDAIGGTMSEMGSNRTSELNQLLIELDGITRSNVITIGATNQENNLDPAFMRSGRFDRKGHEFVELDLLWTVDDRPVMHASHTAIYQVRKIGD